MFCSNPAIEKETKDREDVTNKQGAGEEKENRHFHAMRRFRFGEIR